MNATIAFPHGTAIPPEVQKLAIELDVREYLDDVVELAQRAFPASAVQLSVGQDSEDEVYKYLAVDVESEERTADELLAGQEVWSKGLAEVCPARQAVHFVLGWQ